MKKTIILTFAFLMLFSLASASIEFDNDTYEIDTWVPNWLGGEGYSNVTLIDNTDYCLIDCESTLEFNNEVPVVLTEEIAFVNKVGTDVKDKKK